MKVNPIRPSTITRKPGSTRNKLLNLLIRIANAIVIKSVSATIKKKINATIRKRTSATIRKKINATIRRKIKVKRINMAMENLVAEVRNRKKISIY